MTRKAYCLCQTVLDSKHDLIAFGSVHRNCSSCEELIWVAPSSIKHEHEFEMICFSCYTFLNNTLSMSPGGWIPGQQQEIENQLGRECMYCPLCQRMYESPIHALAKKCSCTK